MRHPTEHCWPIWCMFNVLGLSGLQIQTKKTLITKKKRGETQVLYKGDKRGTKQKINQWSWGTTEHWWFIWCMFNVFGSSGIQKINIYIFALPSKYDYSFRFTTMLWVDKQHAWHFHTFYKTTGGTHIFYLNFFKYSHVFPFLDSWTFIFSQRTSIFTHFD